MFSNIYTIFRKELNSYFNSPIAYIFIVIFLVIINWLFFQRFFLIGEASLRNFFLLLPWFFLLFVPAIAMRTFAEEKKTKTLELLLTLPVRDEEIVLGKFLAGLAFVVVALFFSLTLPVSVSYLGDLDWGPVIGGYLAACLLAGAYLSLGMFISSLTKNQIIAFVVAFFVSFLLFIVGTNFILETMPSFLASLFSFLGIGRHFDNVAKGVIDTRDIVYYLSFIFFFLWLTVKYLGSRHWR